MKIVLLGYIIKGPLAGMSLHYLQFCLGFKEMGHKVLFYEDSNDNFPSCYNPESLEMSFDPTYGLNYAKNLFESYGLGDNWTYYDTLTGEWHGLSKQKALAFCEDADMVINISGVNPLRDWWAKISCRVFIDTDCIFTQIKMLQQQPFFEYVKSHTCHFTFGENIGQADCKVPTASINWKTTRQPVYIDMWEKAPLQPKSRWTTVMAWDSHHYAEYNGERFGMKSNSFFDYLALPKLLGGEIFEMGIKCDATVINELNQNKWVVIDPQKLTKTIPQYQQFIADSKGEWSVAKHGFVYSRCGYLSERSLNFMASGKPAVIQDTGFSKFYPMGEGLFAFNTIEQASDAISRINKDYGFHCKKARSFVEEHANSSIVLKKMLSEI